MLDHKMCRECGASVFFAQNAASGKSAIVDSIPRLDGNIIVNDDDTITYLKKGEQPPAGTHRYVSHFATCSNPKRFRRG